MSGTYGAIIQHIEPIHIADLLVPRLGNKFESQVSNLIEEAAVYRSTATEKRKSAIEEFHRLINWKGLGRISIGVAVSSADLLRRMDAFHHGDRVSSGVRALALFASARIGDQVEKVFEPNRGARLKVDDPEYGLPFLSSSEVFEINPTGEYLISRARTPNLDSLLLSSTDLLIPRSGQLGGIIGRAVLPLAKNIGNAGSEHLIRVRCFSEADAAYLWAALASEPGYWALVGTAYGSSIPSLDSRLIEDIQVPWFDAESRHGIAVLVQEALRAQEIGIEREAKAIRLVEERISEAK